MEKIKVIMDTLDVKELLLTFTRNYFPEKVRIVKMDSDFEESYDIIITQDYGDSEDKFYGRYIQGKYYFARHKYIDKRHPDIDYYEEFFSNGQVIL